MKSRMLILLFLAGTLHAEVPDDAGICTGPIVAEDAQFCSELIADLELRDRARLMPVLLAREDTESKVALLLLFDHALDPDERERILRDALAGAAVQPRTLAVLKRSCEKRAETEYDCASIADRIVALEPANAWAWMERASHRHLAGDAEGARADLLASGRSSYYYTPLRELLRIAWAARISVPADAELARLVCLRRLAALWPDGDRNAFCANRQALDHASEWFAGVSLAMSGHHLEALRARCGTAMAAQDGELLAACRRLTRMVERSGDSFMDALFAMRLQIEIGEVSEIGAVRARQAELQALLDRVALDSGQPMLAMGFRDHIEAQIEHGEVEALRRWLERVDGRITDGSPD